MNEAGKPGENRMTEDTRHGPDEEYPARTGRGVPGMDRTKSTRRDPDDGDPVRALTGCGDIFVNMFSKSP